MESILRTKLFIPPVPIEAVPRPRLKEQLELDARRKLTLVTAPAGYGKTTLVTTWLQQLEEQAAQVQVAWLSLDEADNDLYRFFAYFFAALTQLDDAFQTLHAELMQSSRHNIPVLTLAASLINSILTHGESIIFVLDDYHEIHELEIHEALTFLLDNQPPNLHLVITSRSEPPLPLPRLRVRRELTEIDTDALRFTREEAADFFNQHMRLDLSAHDIAQLDSMTEGWVASLQLAALSLQNKDDTSEFIQTFRGDNRYIVDYLVNEVLDRQPRYIRDFLLQTSILERLNVQLCNALTEQVGSQHILETLDKTRLFVIPLDDRRHWYRYHHLFADCLQTELQRTMPGEVVIFHERASRWLNAHGFWGEAIDHALSANNDALAADLVANNARALLWEHGETERPWRWIQQLPETEVRSRPPLLITKAWLYQELFLDRGAHVNALLDDAAEMIDRGNLSYGVAEIAEMRTEIALARANLERLRGNMRDAIQYCLEAVALIGEIDSPVLKTGALHSLTVSYHQAGDIERALIHSTEQFDPRNLEMPLDYAHQVSLAYRIDALRLNGQLSQAEREVQRYAPSIPLSLTTSQHSGAAMVMVSWAEILRERNELEQASAGLLPAIEALKPLQSMAAVVQSGTTTLARIMQAQGEGQTALQLLQETLQEFAAPDVHYPSARVSATAALLHLRQGNLTAAKAWAEKSGLGPDDEPTYLLEIDYLVFARILIADGAVQAAQILLTKIERAAARGNRVARLIEIQTLQALAHQSLGEPGQAHERLGQALELARPAGFLRLFVDEGQTLATLLKAIAGRGVAIEYIRQILSFIDRSTETYPLPTIETGTKMPTISESPKYPETDPAILLINPLTERELTTLRYLSTDLTIPEIAEQMIVAPSTIRTYVKRIYGKLDVHTRVEALNRARSLGLVR